MLVVADALDAFYLGSFLFGIVFTALGHLIGAVHFGPGGHAGGGHGAVVPKAAGHHDGPGAVNFLSVLSFVSWFGGVGYQARHAFDLVTPASVVCGLFGGLLGASIVGVFFAKVVVPNDRALDPEDFRMEGVAARGRSSTSRVAFGTSQRPARLMGGPCRAGRRWSSWGWSAGW